MKLDTWIGSKVYNINSILFSIPVCSSVRLFSSLLNSGSFDNLKIIKVRRMKLDTWIGSNVYNMHSIFVSLPVCSSVRLFSGLLNSGSCDNLKMIKVRCMKCGVSISSNYTNTDFNLKLIKNGNKQERMIIKELFEGPVGDYCIACNIIKCLLFNNNEHWCDWLLM